MQLHNILIIAHSLLASGIKMNNTFILTKDHYLYVRDVTHSVKYTKPCHKNCSYPQFFMTFAGFQLTLLSFPAPNFTIFTLTLLIRGKTPIYTCSAPNSGQTQLATSW